MSITNAIASVAVTDIEPATRWYARLFGRQPDSRPISELSEWRFQGGGGLQIYQLAERAGSGSVTLAVSDIVDQASQLEQRGIDTGWMRSGSTARTMMITDPDGNHIAFAQAIDRAITH